MKSNQQYNSASKSSCPVCASQRWQVFYRIESVPVECASVYPTEAAATSVGRGQLELAICSRCGFVFNRAFSPELARIGAVYESSQGASVHFSAYALSWPPNGSDDMDWRAGWCLKWAAEAAIFF